MKNTLNRELSDVRIVLDGNVVKNYLSKKRMNTSSGIVKHDSHKKKKSLIKIKKTEVFFGKRLKQTSILDFLQSKKNGTGMDLSEMMLKSPKKEISKSPEKERSESPGKEAAKSPREEVTKSPIKKISESLRNELLKSLKEEISKSPEEDVEKFSNKVFEKPLPVREELSNGIPFLVCDPTGKRIAITYVNREQLKLLIKSQYPNKKSVLVYRHRNFNVNSKSQIKVEETSDVDVETVESEDENCNKLEMDKKTSSEEKTKFYYCDDCDYRSARKCQIRVHISRKHLQDSKRKTSTRCRFSTRSSVVKKIQTPNQMKANKTEKIHQELLNKEEKLEAEDKRIDLRITYYCNECNFKTHQKKKIQLHILSKHSVDPNIMYCSKCSKIFEEKENLNRHESLCGMTVYQCIYCPKYWSRPGMSYSSTIIMRHLKRRHAKQMKNRSWNGIYDEILNRGREKRAYLLKSIQIEKKASKRVNIKIMFGSDPMVKLFCCTCNTTFDISRGKRRDCKKCGSRIHFQCMKCKKVFATLKIAGLHVSNVCYSETMCESNNCDSVITNKENFPNNSQKSKTQPSIGKLRRLSEFDNGVVADNEIKFYCKKCSNTFETMREVGKRYMKECPKCGIKMNTKCSVCDKLFNCVKSAKSHVQYVCQPKEYFKCTDCNLVTTRKCAMRKHTLIKHSKEYDKDLLIKIEEIVKNSGIKKNSEKSDSTLSHKNVARRFTHFCKKCDFKTDHKNDIQLHMMSEHSVNPDSMYCSKCNKSFEVKVKLLKHEITCGSMVYKCIFCPKSWSCPSQNIRTHVKIMHTAKIKTGDLEKIHEKILKRGREMKENILKTAKADKNILRELGIKSLYIPDEMINTFCCKCNKKFNVVRGKHKIYQKNCSKCDTKLSFRCKKCNKSFRQLRFAKIHVSEKCYSQQKLKCSKCSYICNTNKNLRFHIQQHHGKSHKKYQIKMEI